jgi:hypothetical protein
MTKELRSEAVANTEMFAYTQQPRKVQTAINTRALRTYKPVQQFEQKGFMAWLYKLLTC